MRNRLIALALSFALLCQLLPISVFAVEGSSTPQEEVVAEMEPSQAVKTVLGELTDRRGEGEKHFRLNDGNFIAVDYGAAVHYTTDDGATWEDIDNTLVPSRDDSKRYAAENGSSSRGFASDLGDGRLFDVTDGDYSLRVGLGYERTAGELYNASATAEISYPDRKARGNEELSIAEQVTPSRLRTDVLYRDVFDGVDLRYELYSYHVKETILLNRPRDSYEFSFELELEGLEPVALEDGSIELRNEEGTVVYLIPAPYMYDAAGAESDAVTYELEQTASGAWTLTVAADADWINDEERVFPVAIDPTVYFAGNSSNDQIYSGYINDNSPNTHPSDSSSYIRCGNYQNNGATAGHAIGLIYVNKLPSIPENCVVTTSMLKLFQTNYSNGNEGYYNYPRLYTSQITDSSFDSNAAESFINSLTWNNLTNKVYYGGGTSPETRTTVDYTKCKISTLGVHYFEITETTRQWYEDSDDISRLLVLDDGQRNMSINTRATFSGYGNGNFGHQPQLVVLYRNTIGVEGYYDYHTQNIGRAGTASVNNFTMGLSLLVPVYSAPSQALPFGITLTYNSPLSNADFTSSSSVHTRDYTTSATGYGWKTSVQQTVTRVLLTGSDGTNRSWLIYTDADGTEHYFQRKNQTMDYEDEDGLGLTITVNNIDNPTTFTMKDKEENTWTFLYGYLSSYVDNNGNALYYAYNGYDYSSDDDWNPTSANSVYRVTSVWRKNNGVSSVTKLVTLNYTDNHLSSIVDMASRTTTFGYDTNNNLTTITYPDGQTASYTYSNKTVTDPQTNTAKTFHRLVKARDNEAQYEVRYTYWPTIAPRVKEIKEYSGAVGSEAAGTILRGFKTSATTTLFRYCGADNTLSTEDDIIVRYHFDHWGRPVNVVSYDVDGCYDPRNILGVSVGAYKQNKDANKDNNRMTHAAASGMQSVNLLYNSGIEHLTNNTGDLYGWTVQGNGAAAARTTSETTPEITPRTGAYMMKLYLESASSGQESCYQTVYLAKDETYVFSGYVNTAAVSRTGTVGAYLSFRTSSGADISGASSRILNYKTSTAVDNGWERLEAVFTPDQSGTYQVAVNLSHMAKVILADDLQLEKVTGMGGPEGEAGASSANLIQLGGFELPTSTGTSNAEVSNFWTFSMNSDETEYTVSVEDDADPNRGKVIRLHNEPDRQVRAKQNVILNAPANRTYIVSAWGKLPVGYTSDGTDMKYNNQTYKPFFGIIARIYYVGYSTPEDQYVAFNCALGDWQYTSGMIVPKKTSRTVERIELNITGDLLANDAYVDDVTLIQEPVQTYTYDQNGNLTATTNTEGQTSTELDSNNRLEKYTAMNGVVYNLTYEGDSRQPKTITCDGVTTTYNYDESGNVSKNTVQAGSTGPYLESSATYDSTKNFPASAIDTNGNTSYTSYNVNKGLLANATNPKGVVTYYTYNSSNDRADSTYLDGNDKVKLNYRYDANGRLLQLNRTDWLGGSPTYQGYHFSYDAWSNVTQINVGAAYSDLQNSLYSSIWLAKYEYNDNGTLAKMVYTNSDYVLYSYDLLDRLISEEYYTYSDVPVVAYHYVYNANGQLSRQYAVRNGDVVEGYSFEYDTLGRLIRSREEDPDGATVQRTEHLYDTANRLTTQSWVVGSKSFSEEYAYDDDDGSLSQFRLRRGSTENTLVYQYDALKRLSSITCSEGNTNLYSRNYSYLDVAGTPGRTTTQVGTYTVQDANSSLIIGNQYEYDANGNIEKVKEAYLSGNTVAYRYVAEYTYDELNQLKTETRKTYTGASTIPDTTTVVTYTIDTAGNISTVETKVNNVTTDTVTYTYGDNYWSDRLSAITIGNVTKSITYTYYGGGNCNPKTWYNGTEYTNLTWAQGRRLTGLTKGSSIYSYEYDMSGVRSVKITDGWKHEYVTQNGRVVREKVTDANTGAFQYVLEFCYDESGHPLTLRWYYNEAETWYNSYYYICNAQGDVVKLVSDNGAAIAAYSYDAWGMPISIQGESNGNTFVAYANPLRYRGYYYDQETGFYYLQSRYYDPIVKRFLNADTYGSTGQGFLGYNMFAYCGNNPVTQIDFTGNFITPTEIHNYVVQHICDSTPGLCGKDTFVWYSMCFSDSKGIHYYGFCDIFSLDTGEIWEVKRYGGGVTCSMNRAVEQLNRYVMGTLRYHNDLPLSVGGEKTTIDATEFTVYDFMDNCLYTIAYWDAGDGIIYYDYQKTQFKKKSVATYVFLTAVAGVAVLWLALTGDGTPLQYVKSFA